MRWEIWGRYFLQLLLCLPAGILCLAPVRGRLRVGRRMLATLVIVAVTLFAALGATVLQATYWPENALLVPALVLFYALYRRFVERAKELGIHKVETGEFGAHMDVLAANDGPVTIIIDTERIGK